MNKKLAKKKISINKLSKVYGGKWLNTQNGTTINSSGCVVTVSDLYLDSNDNGLMDNDEWKTLQTCTHTQCP